MWGNPSPIPIDPPPDTEVWGKLPVARNPLNTNPLTWASARVPMLAPASSNRGSLDPVKGILHVGVCSAMGTLGAKEEKAGKTATEKQNWHRGSRVVPLGLEGARDSNDNVREDDKDSGASTFSPDNGGWECPLSFLQMLSL